MQYRCQRITKLLRWRHSRCSDSYQSIPEEFRSRRNPERHLRDSNMKVPNDSCLFNKNSSMKTKIDITVITLRAIWCFSVFWGKGKGKVAAKKLSAKVALVKCYFQFGVSPLRRPRETDWGGYVFVWKWAQIVFSLWSKGFLLKAFKQVNAIYP